MKPLWFTSTAKSSSHLMRHWVLTSYFDIDHMGRPYLFWMAGSPIGTRVLSNTRLLAFQPRKAPQAGDGWHLILKLCPLTFCTLRPFSLAPLQLRLDPVNRASIPCLHCLHDTRYPRLVHVGTRELCVTDSPAILWPSGSQFQLCLRSCSWAQPREGCAVMMQLGHHHSWPPGYRRSPLTCCHWSTPGEGRHQRQHTSTSSRDKVAWKVWRAYSYLTDYCSDWQPKVNP